MRRLLCLILLMFLWQGYIPPKTVVVPEKPILRKSSLDLPKNPENFRYIRVALFVDAGSVHIASETPYQVFDYEGNLLTAGDILPESLFWIGEGKFIYWGNQSLGTHFIRLRGDIIKVGKYNYRDTVLIWVQDDGTLLIVNELSVEDYLKGVLPWEVSPDWDMESLRAQAVASRTYALFRMMENQNERFDVSSGVMSQVYKGQSIEKPQTNEAVESTRGQVLIYDGKIFPAFFHSTAGGSTTSASDIWNLVPHPSLTGVVTGFEKNSKHFSWTGKFQVEDILTALRAKGYDLPDITRIAAEDIDASGRARIITVGSSVGQVSVSANDFRIWVGPGKFKSTKLSSIEFKGNWIEFKGFGWGHGVGMCQYSAKYLGEIGYNYKQILEYFYQQSHLAQFYRPSKS